MMLYRNVLNFLRGSVQVEIECACPERVLNLCAVEEIAFWDLQWLSPIALRLRVTRRGWRALREVCTRADAQASRLRERGAPQLLLRLRTRYALLAALALFALLLFGGNLFIWSFEVTGNETVPTETILRALEKCGVAVGSQGLKIHQEDVRNRALLELPDVAWLAVNVRGCVAHVQVVERKRPPAVVQESQVCNVVARREGLVTRVQALDGKAVTAPGSVVTEGELLISGVADSETFKLPTAESFVGLKNYVKGMTFGNFAFYKVVFYSFFITIASTALILLCTSMAAWYISRVGSLVSKIVYYLCVFSMVVPFQMVMYTLARTTDQLHLNTPWTIPVIYLGFGAGLAVFMFTGFVKSLPLEIEEAAAIDGCGPVGTFFRVVLPMLKPTMISVGVLEIMWVWNDYLLENARMMESTARSYVDRMAN